MSTSVSLSSLRADLTRYGHLTSEKGFVAATDGNLSARVPGSTPPEYLISPSGMSLGELRPESFVHVDRHGNPLGDAGGLGLLRVPDAPGDLRGACRRGGYPARSSAHHPRLQHRGTGPRGLRAPRGGGGARHDPHGRVRDPDHRCHRRGGPQDDPRRDALILDRHGTVTVGTDIRDAYLKLEKVEHTAHISLVARTLGRVRTLPPEEVAKLLAMREKLGLPPVVPHCNNCGLGCM